MSAKPKSSPKPKPSAGPSELVLRLHQPGMTAMHRAGLGGLACTLTALKRAVKSRQWSLEETPGWPWPSEDEPPWEITAHSITLKFGEPTAAREYLRRLFAFAFQIKDGLIYLPGQYRSEPPLEVRAYLQSGLTLTFLQHGQSKTLAKEATVKQYDTGEGAIPAEIQFRACADYRHQTGWEDGFFDKDGCLDMKARLKVAGPLSPGAVVRHVGLGNSTGIDEPPPHETRRCVLPPRPAMRR